MGIPDEKKLIVPMLPAGCQDFSPAEVMLRNEMFRKIAVVYESFGFVPLQTSEFEFDDVLTGGDPGFTKEIFRVVRRNKSERGHEDEDAGRPLGLRFDLTVPLARYVAAHQDLPMPFKRYQLGPVWRAEKPQAGRFRQFWQFDADTVGSDSVRADAEIITIMDAVMRALAINKYLVRFNDRKLLNGLLQLCEITDEAKVASALRTMDKFEKIGADGVAVELQRQPDNQFDETALALGASQVARILAFLELGQSHDDSEAALSAAEQMLGGNPLAREGIAELREICGYLDAGGVNSANWRIDFSISRGLGYYTGPVFETTLLDLPDVGSVFSGGRFDGLVGRFSNRNLPATGASVGVDRLLYALQQLGMVPQDRDWIDVFIVWLDPSLSSDYYRMATELRAAGLRVEVSLSREQALRSQMGLAQSRGCPVVVMYGQDEASNGLVQLKKLVPVGQPANMPIKISRDSLVQGVVDLRH